MFRKMITRCRSKNSLLIPAALGGIFLVVSTTIFVQSTLKWMLLRDAHQGGVQWVELIEANMDDLDIHLTGEEQDQEKNSQDHHDENHFFDAVLAVGHIYHIDLFDASGVEKYSFSADHKKSKNHSYITHNNDGMAGLNQYRSKRNVAHKAMRNKIEARRQNFENDKYPVDEVGLKELLKKEVHKMSLMSGNDVAHPLKYAEIFHPMYSGDKLVGMARVYVNLTTNYGAYLRVLVGSALFILLVVLVAFSAPWYLFVKSERQKKIADQKAHYLAKHDALTGLVNRARFDQLVDEAVEEHQDRSENYAIHYVDVDLFKEVNDFFGHDTGDELLMAIAGRLKSAVRENDVVARIGGDEFAVLQNNVRREKEATIVADRITSAFDAPFDLPNHRVSVSVSVGVAISGQEDKELTELKKNADIALYWVKKSGRNGHKVFAAGMDEELVQRKELEATIRRAIDEDLFQLHFQPQLDQVSKKLVGFEALLRLRDQNGEFIPPNTFIPIAEEIKLIGEIGHWVIRRATATAATWPEPINVAINLSPEEFNNDRLVDTIKSALKESGLAPNRLEIEVTEGLLLDDTSRNMETLEQIKALGVSVAMDDFGTGYSSLSYLWRFPFDKVKIDRSFIQAVGTEQEKVSEVIRTIITLGHSMHMKAGGGC